MVKCLSVNPSLDKSLIIKKLIDWDINRVASSRLDAGSKGINVARTIKVLGGRAEVWGFLAGYVGKQIKSQLASSKIAGHFVWVKGENRLIINIFETTTGREIRLNEHGPFVTKENYREFLSSLLCSLTHTDYLTMSGSLPEGLSDRAYSELIKKAKKVGCKVFLDSDNEPLRYGISAGPYLVRMNRFELKRWAKIPVDSISDIERAGRKVLKLGVEVVVVSGGEKEVLCLSDGKTLIAYPPRVKAESSIGAGDSMLAGIVFSLAKSQELEDALRLGVACGSAAVQTQGTSMPSNREIMRLLKLVDIKLR